MGEVTFYHQLLEEFKYENKIPYYRLLQTREWFDKRLKILNRDNHKCKSRNCLLPPGYGEPDAFGGIAENQRIVLQVHHNFYVTSWLPWNYPDDALITLCSKCHQHLHNTQEVKAYKENRDYMLEETDCKVCSRCSGSGFLYQYDYVQNGVCFKCGGLGFEPEENLL